MKYGLNEIDIARINETFANFPAIEQAVIFGSRAKGNYKPASDIDITLKGKQLNIHTLNQVSRQLDDLLLPYTFDLSIFLHINNVDLIDHIERVGQVFYSRK